MSEAIDWEARLNLAVRWCTIRMQAESNIDDLFRTRGWVSDELWQRFVGHYRGQYFHGRTSEIFAGQSVSDQPTLVETIIAKREARAGQFKTKFEFRAGRIIAYQYEEALSNGLASIQSLGYLDHSECPGWDTWLGIVPDLRRRECKYCQNVLMCWVPRQFINFVQAGIDVDPVRPLIWIEEYEPASSLSELLRLNEDAKSAWL